MYNSPDALGTAAVMNMLDTVHEGDCLAEYATLYAAALEAIPAAQARHPQQSAALADTFDLLKPTHPGFCSGPLYRAHCAEILARVANGHDTRPATGPEMMLAMRATIILPFTQTAVALFLRLWKTAELPEIEPPAPLPDYEDGPKAVLRVDILAAELRGELTHEWRTATTSTEPGDPAA
ncbi:hypothetical protein [Nocardia sp. NBC_00511]|uniref:hypothetical protein n=1 Tax=Nocardia sp. NBC_00511 TaxID=2903591 RepID=UPI002F9140F6